MHLNYLNINDSVAYDLLSTFVKYNYSLKVLDLAHNNIEGDGHYMNLICYIPTLENIDFSHNTVSIAGLFPNSFKCTSKITTLDVSNFIWYLFHADNKVPNLVSFHSSNSIISIYHSKSTIYAPRLKDLYLSKITLNIEYVGSAIKLLNIFDAPQLDTLDLSSNQISAIDKEDARRLSTVTFLDLRDNMLTSLSTLSHLNVGVLLLSGNQITSVRGSLLLSYDSLQILDMHDNIFICECLVEGFQKWLLIDKQVYLGRYFSEADINRYKCVGPQSSKGLSITEIDFDYCEKPLLMYISISVICGLVTIIAVILVARYRWHIQYRVFLLFNRRAYQNYLVIDDDDDHDDFEDEDGVPRYDAYVIYHNQDEDWVDEQLLANIEEDHEEPFRLCLKNRDIRAGRLIFNELSLHIRRSRKILVILTPRFVDDNWCYFQLNMAHHRVLEENHNVLIFIILEEIPNNKLTLLLRQLFCKVCCLKWPNDEHGQRLFWRRLREELKRPVPRDDQVIQYRLYNI